MRNCIQKLLGRFSLLGLLMWLGTVHSPCDSRCRAAEATIQVKCDQSGHKISPRLVGVFFEDINFGADGGFSAELVKNGSFDFPVELLGWKKLGEDVTVKSEREAPLKSANPTYIRLTSDDESPRGGVENDGYRGMGVKQGEGYLFSAQARSTAGEEMKLELRLVAMNGDVLAQQQVRVGGSAWSPLEVELKPSRTEAKARLQLLLLSSGTVDLDLISLCPRDTWKSRPKGLRKDLVQLLADLKPAFFRFPGGCIVEGSQLKYRYQWKSTIGPRDERRLLVNRWNSEFGHRPAPDYYQSFAVGFFEYFQLAADIGAEPLPILNCGMACQFNSGELVPLDELGPYIQDALDLIEFANGPATSEWGGKRAQMGRPEPFGMRLLGIGNEQWGPEYFERYTKFAEVLQEKHPEIELISTSGPFPSGDRFDYAWPLLRQLKAPVVDEHCYAMPDWFLREATRYDNYDRQGPKVFMGEYAAQSVQLVSPLNRNTLRCALAEAAFLTGIERNSDVVTLSAYAPLMAHEDAWQWRPNLMWFDNLAAYGSPSYYTQLLFSRHRGDETRPTQVTYHRPPRQPGGRIGVGSSQASVEFRNLKVESGEQVLLDQAAIDSPDDLFKVGIGSQWEVESGVVRQTRRSGDARAMLGDYGWHDCAISLEARKVEGGGGVVVLFRNGPGGSRVEWNLGGRNNRSHQLVSRLATHFETPQIVAEVPGVLEKDRWYDVRIELSGSKVKCFLDGRLIHDVDLPDPEIARLYAVAGADLDSGETILKVVNPTDDATAVAIDLAGAELASKTCKLILLTGQPEDENTIDAPTRVAPVESTLELSGAKFEHSFPAHSMTVLRIKIR